MSLLDRLSIVVIYMLTAGLVLLVAELGFRLGVWLRRRDPSFLQGSMPVAEVAGLLGLLGFLLAFSIGIAVNHFDTRRGLVVADANAIGTTYLRTSFLGEPERTNARDLLREYVDLRLTALDAARLEDARRRSEEIHNQLWLIVEGQASQNQDGDTVKLFVDAVNHMFDTYGQRLAAVSNLRLRPLMWQVLYGTAVLTFFLVGLVSSADGKRNAVVWILLSLVLAAVLMLIADLDRSQGGALTVTQQALWDLHGQFAAPAP
jgi:hypothetical protein